MAGASLGQSRSGHNRSTETNGGTQFMKTPLENQRELDAANLTCARIILAGFRNGIRDEGIEVEWARLILARAEEKSSDVGIAR